jgi:hypothetical protein
MQTEERAMWCLCAAAAGLRVCLVVLAELVTALGTVVEDGCTFIRRTELESVEVHLVVAASRTLFLDGGFLWFVVITKSSCCVDQLTLLTQR